MTVDKYFRCYYCDFTTDLDVVYQTCTRQSCLNAPQLKMLVAGDDDS